MHRKRKHKGFSLAEVLLSVGILAVGMTFVAGVFPVAIYFATIATERTIAAVAADEAFAKVRLYGVNVSSIPTITCVDFSDVSSIPLDPSQFIYPSTNTEITPRQYRWSALCRLLDPTTRLVQVTVFISRRTMASGEYWYRTPTDPNLLTVPEPVPIPVSVSQPGNLDELWINDFYADDNVDETTFINDGCTIVDRETGQLYRVLERYSNPPNRIILDRIWQGRDLSIIPGWVWVVPPPVNSGRYPCIAVYQKVIQF